MEDKEFEESWKSSQDIVFVTDDHDKKDEGWKLAIKALDSLPESQTPFDVLECLIKVYDYISQTQNVMYVHILRWFFF